MNLLNTKHICIKSIIRNSGCTLILGAVLMLSSCAERRLEVDVLIVGGGASGVMAGVQASRMQTKTLIVEETPWLGGMLTSAGVSAIDGNNMLPAGLWGEFRDSLAAYYGGRDSLETGWVSNTQFEPSVGNRILNNMCSSESNLTVWQESRIDTIIRQGNEWEVRILTADGKKETVFSKVLIDGTELGDVAKACGVGYDLGMESREVTGEKIAPEAANHIIQDLTYVAILKDYGVDKRIARPASYDSTKFACACASDICTSPKEPDRVWSPDMMITYGKLPNNKYMINWPIEGNDYYLNLVEMTPEQRAVAVEAAKEYTRCFLYYIQHQLGMNTLSFADDEFPTSDLFPFIPYHRESRRIHGEVRFDLNDLQSPYGQQDALYRACAVVGDYPVDHHHQAYRGEEELPNLYFYPVPSYGLPIGCLIPKDVDGLIVAEKSISVSNLVNGTTRLQPVVLQIGQLAGIMASLSVKQNKEIRELDVREIQNEMLHAGGYLLPYLDREKKDPMFKPLQRIGATGILKGVGRNVEWKNQTWLRADTLLLPNELDGLSAYYPKFKSSSSKKPMTVGDALQLIETIAQQENMPLDVQTKAEVASRRCGFNLDASRKILRGEMAVLIDDILDPFNRKPVGLHGELLSK